MNKNMQKMNRGGEKKKMMNGGKAKMMNGGMPVVKLENGGKVKRGMARGCGAATQGKGFNK